MRPGTRPFGIGVGLLAALLANVVPAARALEIPREPRVRGSAAPTDTTPPAGPTLPYGSTVLLVLDDKISSATTRPGTKIRLHVARAVVVNGVTLAPAGAPATLDIVTASGAEGGDRDGAVQIHLEPLQLPGRSEALLIRAPHEYLTMERSAGQLSTREATDTIGDIFIPYHILYHVLRPGQQFVLPVGSILRAQTAETIDASDPSAIVFSTPAPFRSMDDTPHSDVTEAPLFTPAPERPHPLPKGRPTLPPSPAPGSSALPSPGAAATATAASPGQPLPAATATIPTGPASPATPAP